MAFPPLADGVTSFQNYLANIGVTIDATAASNVELTNSQVGASLPYTFDITAAAGATVDVTGNSYVFGTMTLDADVDYDRQLFVGGGGVTDNDAQIRNSTFIVNSQLGADTGMIAAFDADTDIETCTFQLATGTTTGHAIKIVTPGTYTFTGLTFDGFGADGTNTAAVYNDSGGSVTIISDGGTTPTVRNGTGASTTLALPDVQLTLTGLKSGTEVQIHQGTTQVVFEENITDGDFVATVPANTGSINVHVMANGYQFVRFALTSQPLTSRSRCRSP